MKTEVRYYSRGGNTEELAKAVAEAVGAEALTVDNDLNEKADLVFVGASIYAGKPDQSVITFIKRNAKEIGTIAVFGSSASGRSSYDAIKAAAEEEGINVIPSDFSCFGAFMFLHRKHPNEKDLSLAAAFAKAVQEELPAQ